MGFNPSFRRTKKAGDGNRLYGKLLHYRKDRWSIRLKRRAEVLSLLEILPIGHPEKIEKRKMLFDLKDKIYIRDIEDQWAELKNKIRKGVDAYVLEGAFRSRLSDSSLSKSDARL